jgi:hypothetical protein
MKVEISDKPVARKLKEISQNIGISEFLREPKFRSGLRQGVGSVKYCGSRIPA